MSNCKLQQKCLNLSISNFKDVLQSQIQIQISNPIKSWLYVNWFWTKINLTWQLIIDENWCYCYLQEKYKQLLAQIPELRWIPKFGEKSRNTFFFVANLDRNNLSLFIGRWPNEERTSCISSTCRGTPRTPPSSWRCSMQKRDSYHAWMGRLKNET